MCTGKSHMFSILDNFLVHGYMQISHVFILLPFVIWSLAKFGFLFEEWRDSIIDESFRDSNQVHSLQTHQTHMFFNSTVRLQHQVVVHIVLKDDGLPSFHHLLERLIDMFDQN